MKDARFVHAENIRTLEQYGTALLSSMISLRTLEAFHLSAFEKGILNDDESECGKTICWELRRLMALYTHQIKNVLERAPLDQEQVIKELESITKKRKPRKKREDERDSVNT